ncbi:hypothetical protein AKJ16_DCAP05003 [Drosera capensis]
MTSMINHIGERGKHQLDLSPPLSISFPLSINAITVTQNDVVVASLSLSRVAIVDLDSPHYKCFLAQRKAEVSHGGLVDVTLNPKDQGKRQLNLAMAVENVLTSPHRRTQTQFSTQSPASKKQLPPDMSFASLVQRHRFLLTALILLVLLCTVYLYFAVTLGSNGSCSGLLGGERELCQLRHTKDSLSSNTRKLKSF